MTFISSSAALSYYSLNKLCSKI